MLLPQELKKYSFDRAIRGYNTAEVEEYIAFVITKYEEIYRENDELNRKLSIAVESLAEIREREAKIAALEKAVKRAAAKLLASAEKKRDELVAEAAAYADRIVKDADAHVDEQKKQFLRIQAEILTLRDMLFTAYSEHIDRIEALTALAEEKDFSDPAPILADAAEEILPEDPAEENAAEEPQSADVYTEQELEEEEAAEVIEEEPLMSAADEDVYTPEELSDDDNAVGDTTEEDTGDSISNAEDASEEIEEVPTKETETQTAAFDADTLEIGDLLAEIPAEEKPDDDALLRELHEVFAKEFAAAESDPSGSEDVLSDDWDRGFEIKHEAVEAPPSEPKTEIPNETPEEPNEEHADEDAELDELKRRMGLTDEIKKYPGIDSFEFIPEDAPDDNKRGGKLHKKNK